MTIKRKTKSRATELDVHVGSKLRSRRLLLGMSQENLGNALGLTFQQVQKYERGTNCMTIGRLLEISKVLNAPLDFFLEGLNISKPAFARGFADTKQEAFEGDVMSRKETMELIRAYYTIPDERLRKQLLEMARTMAANIK